MTELYVVVAYLLVGEGLVRLCELDIVVVERLDRLVLGGVGPDFVGVEFDGKPLVV
jgi:hypothetical protein